ncbi:hypothetical protein IQ13_3195 [Lacibacter cauensis]|uniref:Uncharacterized protein n=1 Tax=Lacibacter cauensis TaxID=510947 RepID=A0A562SGV3_9BACT|nr:hypothetical protein [Lacibacter cauensis]TWI80517.1 hypothetical protein IQ13_3195 [Lacibacter cauensis]
MVEFTIEIAHERKRYQLQVKKILETAAAEQYEVAYAGKTVTFQNNWPVFKRRHLKHRQPSWKLIKGDLRYRSIKEAIVSALYKKLQEMEK